MKKHLLSVLCLILGIAVGVCGCLIVLVAGESSGRGQLPVESPNLPREAGLQDSELTALAYTVAGLIREGDYRTLATYIHPVYGLVFAPNSTINLTSNQCFTPTRVAYTAEDSTFCMGAATIPVTFCARPIPLRVAAPSRIRNAEAATMMPMRTPYFFRYSFKGCSLPALSASSPVCTGEGPSR